MREQKLREERWHEVTSPALHDSVGVSPVPGITFAPGRVFKYLDGSSVAQPGWSGYGMNDAESSAYHDERYVYRCGSGRSQRTCKTRDHVDDRTLVGLLDKGEEYSDWLRNNYGLEIDISIRQSQLESDGRPAIVPQQR